MESRYDIGLDTPPVHTASRNMWINIQWLSGPCECRGKPSERRPPGSSPRRPASVCPSVEPGQTQLTARRSQSQPQSAVVRTHARGGGSGAAGCRPVPAASASQRHSELLISCSRTGLGATATGVTTATLQYFHNTSLAHRMVISTPCSFTPRGYCVALFAVVEGTIVGCHDDGEFYQFCFC